MFGILPYGHEDEVTRRFPVVTVSIVALNLLVFAVIEGRMRKAERRLPQILEKIPRYERQMFPGPVPMQDNPFFFTPSPNDVWCYAQAMKPDTTYTYRGVLRPRPEADYERDRVRYEEMKRLAREYDGHYRVAREGAAYEGLAYQGGDKFRIWMPLSSMFVHFGWMHMIGNFIYLMIAGTKIEDLWGRRNFVLLYILGGLAAALAHLALGGSSDVPFGGASGAIMALMGAFLVFCFDTQVKFVWFIFMFAFLRAGTFMVPAYIVFPMMILGDIYSAIEGWNAPAGSGGVAHWAHIGGFFFGLGSAFAIKSFGLERKIFPIVDLDSGGKFVANHPLLLWKNHDLLDEAMSMRARGRCAESAALFEKIAEDHPQAPGPMEEASDAYRMARDSARQQALLAGAVQRAVRARAEEEAIRLYRKLQEAFPGAMLEPAEQFQAAAYLERAGDFPEAAGALRRMLDTGLQGNLAVKCLYRYAQICEQHFHQVEVALDAYRQALIQAGSDPNWNHTIRERMAALQNARKGAAAPSAQPPSPPPPPPAPRPGA